VRVGKAGVHFWADSQLDALDDVLGRARSGQPQLLVVEGQAGTGKTALLDELVSRAEDFHVLAAEGLEHHQTPMTVLRSWNVDPPQTSDGGAAAPFVAAQALREVVDQAAPDRPVLLRLDDLHWADPESVEALTWLLRRTSGDRLLVAVGTRRLRTDKHAGWQHWASGHSHASWLRLTGLGLAHAQELIRWHRPSIRESTAQRLWEHTGGNPLYLTAILEEYDDNRLTQMRMLPAPAAFAQVLGSRVARLPDAAAALLRAVAVLGTGWVSLLDAAAVAVIEDPALAAQVLTDAGLTQLDPLDGTVSIRLDHALVGSAVYSQTPLPHRRELHTRAAEVVTAESVALEHRMAAAEQYDEDLALALQSYATRLYEQRSFRQAGQFQLWSSVLTRSPQRREQRWLESLFYRAMDGDLTTVRAEADKVQRASHHALRALVLGTWAVWERRRQLGIELLGAVSELPLEAVDATTRYRVEVLLAWARIGAGHPSALIADSIARAQGLGVTDAGLGDLELVSAGTITCRVQGPAAAVADLPPLPEAAAAVPLRWTNQLAWRGSVRARAGLLPEALADLSEAARRIEDGVTTFGAGSFHGGLAYLQWLGGDWGLARLTFRLAHDISGPRTHPMVLALAPVSQIGEGRFSEADLMIDEAQRALSEAPWFEACQLLLSTRVCRAHAQGSPGERARLLPSLRGTVLDPTSLLGGSPLLLVHVGLAAVWSSDLALAERCTHELEQTSPQAPWMAPVASWLRGLIAEDRGQTSTALAHLVSAATAMSGGLPLYQAHIWADTARVAGALHRESQALRSRQRAEELYRGLGARPYLDRLAAPRQETAQTHGPAIALTDREKDVVTLVLDGMSYAQIASSLFITQSTVAYHLSNVYAKAGVRSRHRLTEMVREQPRLFGLGRPLKDALSSR